MADPRLIDRVVCRVVVLKRREAGRVNLAGLQVAQRCDDAVVMLDPYTGRRGPRIVAAAATVDTQRNLNTLDAIAATGAGTVLVGHGEPWRHGAAAIVQQARASGPA